MNSDNLKIVIKKVPSGGTFGDLDFRLKKLSTNSGVKFVVFKVDSDIVLHLKDDLKDREKIVSRVDDNVRVYLLSLDDKCLGYKVYSITDKLCQYVNDVSLLEEIRQADFEDVLERSDGKCFHIAENGIHYQTPSGMHTKAFLRLADAIHSFGRLDRISFWLLEDLSKAKAALIDNWSLSSVILHSQSILLTRHQYSYAAY